MIRRVLVVVAGLYLAALNRVEARHGRNTRAYIAGHGALTTRKTPRVIEAVSGDGWAGQLETVRSPYEPRGATNGSSGHIHDFGHFSRVLCGCGWMHTYCTAVDCYAQAEPCEETT